MRCQSATAHHTGERGVFQDGFDFAGPGNQLTGSSDGTGPASPMSSSHVM